MWPPGYPLVIAAMQELFGLGGIRALQLLQLVGSLAIGFAVVQMSHLLFGLRAALVSGIAWACYLPLAYYAHHVWPETLFLALFVPSAYLVLCFLLDTGTRSSQRRLALAGALYGLALYLKEGAFYLAFPLTLLLLLRKPRVSWSTALAFPAALLLVLTPLMIRNYAHYERFVPVGASLGQNIIAGLHGGYQNFDYNRDPGLLIRVHRQAGGWDFVARNFIDYGDGWELSQAENPIDRSREDLATALRYALDRPAAFVGTRIKKLADFVTPLSFGVRDLTPEVYTGVIVARPLRHALIALSLVSVVALLSVSWINWVRIRARLEVALFFGLFVGYFAATALLTSMSRFRIPAIPFLLVLVGASVVALPDPNPRRTRALCAAGLTLLLLLWVLNAPEVAQVVKRSWAY